MRDLDDRCASNLRARGFAVTLDSTWSTVYSCDMDEFHVELDKPWLSVADICEYMDVSTFVVTSVLRSGELPAVKFGREWRVSKGDFESWINQQRVADRVESLDFEPSEEG